MRGKEDARDGRVECTGSWSPTGEAVSSSHLTDEHKKDSEPGARPRAASGSGPGEAAHVTFVFPHFPLTCSGDRLCQGDG